MRKALTIAGSDSGGGAGIQADLKTFAALRVYGSSVVTSVTAQNTLGVQGRYDLPPQFVAEQLDSVLGDIGAHAVKTGMLARAETVEVVAAKLQEYGVENLVVDPVFIAKSGHFLLDNDAWEVMKAKLFPLALVVTPNIEEAQALTGLAIRTEEDMVEAARRIRQWGPKYVVVKGGHLEGEEALDVLFDGRNVVRFSSRKLSGPKVHGTGCAFAAAIAAFLARGFEVHEAVRGAKEYLQEAIAAGRPVGKGYMCLHHMVTCYSWEDHPTEALSSGEERGARRICL